MNEARQLFASAQPRLGKLVQVHGCDHDWFEDRGDRCTALVSIDDATGKLMQLRVSAFDLFRGLGRLDF